MCAWDAFAGTGTQNRMTKSNAYTFFLIFFSLPMMIENMEFVNDGKICIFEHLHIEQMAFFFGNWIHFSLMTQTTYIMKPAANKCSFRLSFMLMLFKCTTNQRKKKTKRSHPKCVLYCSSETTTTKIESVVTFSYDLFAASAPYSHTKRRRVSVLRLLLIMCIIYCKVRVRKRCDRDRTIRCQIQNKNQNPNVTNINMFSLRYDAIQWKGKFADSIYVTYFHCMAWIFLDLIS